MMGPTWADVASAPADKIERRDVLAVPQRKFACPFCLAVGRLALLKHPTGHRCGCGALFYTQQAVAVHFKERN